MEGNSDVPSASTFETQTIGGRGSATINSIHHLSSRSLQLTVDQYLQIVKKVVVTKGRYKDYVNEIRQSNELGFTPYRLHTNKDGIFVTPIRVYDWRLYVLDDVATLQVTARNIATGDNSKLIYFFETDDGSGVALQRDRGPSGVKGLK